MVPSVPLSGDIVAEKYEIGRMLGKGGMGVVFEAKHRKLGTRVAIKFLMPDALGSHDGVARFDREARASALLRSPYVVRVLDIDATGEGLPFIVMEYLEGHDLGSELRRRGTIPLAEAVDWILQACIGLAEAHARGIVHRDIKPANLYLCSEAVGPIVKVMDFGVSKLAGAGEVDLTTTETTVGTPSYMAPEQLLSSKGIDHRVDVWALGVVLYRMLSGTLPFVAAGPTALAIAIATAPPVDLATVAPALPAVVVAAVMRALAKDPNKRHADAIAFGRALEPFGSKRVAFGAAVARMPPPHALDSSRQLAADGDGSTEQIGATVTRSVAWSQKERAGDPSDGARRPTTSRGIALGIAAVATAALVGVVVFGYRSIARSPVPAPPVANVAPSVPPSGVAGAFEAPPATLDPAGPSPTTTPSTLAAAASATTTTPRPARSSTRPPGSATRPPRPSASGAPADDPLHL